MSEEKNKKVKSEETAEKSATSKSRKAEEAKSTEKTANVADEVKSETKTTVNDVKKSMKDVDVKKDAKATSGFITSFFKNPLSKFDEIANDSKYKNFKIAIILVIVWTAIVLISAIGSQSWKFVNTGANILAIIKRILAPIFSIIVFSAIIYCMQKSTKKSLTTILTSVTTAQIPTIIASIISLIDLFSSSAYRLTNPISYFAGIISLIFTYFATKSLLGIEKDNEFIQKFIIIEGIYYIAYLIISFLGIFMYSL